MPASGASCPRSTGAKNFPPDSLTGGVGQWLVIGAGCFPPGVRLKGFMGPGLCSNLLLKINKSWGSFDGYINKTRI